MNKKAFLTIAFILVGILGFCSVAFASSATTVTELMEVLQEDKYSASYDMELNAPYGKESSGVNEKINPETGEVIVNKSILAIPGVNGKDIDLTLTYRSRDAKLYEETTRGWSIDNGYGSTIIAYYDVFNSDGYWLKTGALKYTTYDSTILGQTTIDGDTWIFNGYLQYESGSSIIMSGNIENDVRERSALSAGKYIFGAGWSLSMPMLEVDGDNVYVSLRDGRTYKADFTSGMGLEDYELYDVYFLKDDSYKNAEDQSAYKLYYTTGDSQYFSEEGELLYDEDRFGNFVRYRWDSVDGMRLLKQIEDSAGHVVSIEYYEKDILVTNESMTYRIEKKQVPGHEGKNYLSKMVDSEGREIQFLYDVKQAGFDQLGKTKEDNTYTNLISTIYPTGGRTEYTYIQSEKNIGASGSMEYFKVRERKDLDAGEAKNVLMYRYSLEPDGFPQYNSTEIPDSYKYKTEVTDSFGATTVYWYNNEHNSYYSEVYTDRIMESVRREFDHRNNMPIKETKRAYNPAGAHTEQIDLYEFNQRGNLVQENHIYEGEASDNTNHQIVYSYDEKYDFLLTKSYKQDESTEVRIVNELTEDGKSIESMKVLADDELLQASSYTYDWYGNIIEKSTKIEGASYDVVRYEYAPEYGHAYRTATIYQDVLDATGKSSDVVTNDEYDFATGLPLAHVDGNGNVTTYEYDSLGRLIKEMLADGNYRRFVFDDGQNTIKTIDANKESLLYRYSQLGSLREVAIPPEDVILVKMYYDELNRPMRKEDSSGNYRLISYDQLGRLVSTEDYDSSNTLLAKLSIAYDEAYELDGQTYQRIKVTNKGNIGNRITTYYFDQQGKVQFQGMFFDGVEKLEKYEYDYIGNNLSITDLLGNMTEVAYDGLGRPTRLKDAEGYETLQGYDLQGNLVSQTNANGETVQYQYNQLGRQTVVELPFDGASRSTQKSFYDGNGNLIRTIDPEGNETQYHYNERNLLAAVESVTGLDKSDITRYEYDAEGRVIRTELGLNSWDDPDVLVRTYEYDQFGRITKEADPAGNSKEYTYDSNGNLILETDRNGVSIQYAYDGLNRLVEKENSRDGEPGKITFDYDLLGNTLQVGNRAEVISYQYDENGRMILQESDLGISQQYSYDVLGRPTEFNVEQGNLTQMQLSYDYDNNGNLARISTPEGQYTYGYDPTGRLIEEQNGINGIESTYSYYPSGNLKSLNHVLGEDSIESYLYEYDSIGNRTKEIEGFDITEYSYDSLSRLEMAKMPDGTVQHYSFDDLGNIKSLTEMIETPNGAHMIFENLYTYDECNRLQLKQTTRGEEISYLRFSYDVEDNQIQKDEVFQGIYGTIATLTDEFRYNGYNQLVGVEDSTGSNTYYKYNGQNLRTSKQGSGVTTNFIYDGSGNIIVELDGRSAVTAMNIRGSRLLSREVDGNNYYYLHNAHGDVTKLANGLGRIVEDYTYDPYGNAIDSSDQMQGVMPEIMMSQMGDHIDNPYRYAGEYLDAETGNYYLRARYYDPSTQRFTSEDSYRGELITPSSLNRYAYCMGNPVTFIDPSGNESTEELLMMSHNAGDEITEEYYAELAVYDQNARVAGSVIIGFTPVDIGKDFADLYAGKDIFTGEDINRWILIGCIVLPEAGGQVLRNGKKLKGVAGEFLEGMGNLADGLGTYAKQGGHHPMAKKAFEGVAGYNPRSALTIGQSKLTEFGVKHSTITGQQHSLYKAFSKTGDSLTIDAMKQIEIKAMTNSGVPLDYATNSVEKAIQGLLDSGVTQPSRIPWGK